MKLEIAVVGAEGAGIAADEGADRIELCTALELGGITPSQGLMEAAAEAVRGRLGIHPLIRCRPGDFRYSAGEVDTMVREIRFLLRQGADGVVVGALAADGGIDLGAITRLAGAARETRPGAQLTFHRAIDQTQDPAGSLELLAGLGFTRVLSSGGAPSAGAGLETLRRMAHSSAVQVEVMAGGGLLLSDIPAMRDAGVDAIHLSAKKTISTLGATSFSLGSGDGSDPTAYMVTDRYTVRAARTASR